MEAKKENGYGIFLMYQLANGKLIDEELEYDLAYAKASELYSEFENSVYSKDEAMSEMDAMVEFIKNYHIDKQNILYNKVYCQADVNIVSCGNCGGTLLHEKGDEDITCVYCGKFMALSDCPDFDY